jgi:hypothetical protein
MNGKPLNHNDFSYRQNRGPNGVIEPKAEALSLIQPNSSQSARMPLKHRSNVHHYHPTYLFDSSIRSLISCKISLKEGSVLIQNEPRGAFRYAGD